MSFGQTIDQISGIAESSEQIYAGTRTSALTKMALRINTERNLVRKWHWKNMQIKIVYIFTCIYSNGFLSDNLHANQFPNGLRTQILKNNFKIRHRCIYL